MSSERRQISRRTLLKGFGLGAAAAAGGGLLSACSTSPRSSGGSSKSDIVIGYVSPRTGILAGFAKCDDFVLGRVRATSAYSGGFTVAGKRYGVKIVEADSRSEPNWASAVAHNLILNDRVDMIVTAFAPETTNPVAEVCQAERVPCLSTVVPWESWYAGLGGDPASPSRTYEYNAMFFFGLEELGECFVPMWNRIPTDTVVAEMFPGDADGDLSRRGWPPIIKSAGYAYVDGGAYPDGATDFTPMISLFKSKDAQVYLNGALAADFTTFWKQASQQGYKPRIATVSNVLLLPTGAAALGSLADNVATSAWWTPFGPYRSSMTGETCSDLAGAYQTATGQQWSQSLGSTYSLFEVAMHAFTTSSDPHDREDVAHKLRTTKYAGMSGPLDFASGPAPGVAAVKPVGVQWKAGRPGRFTDFTWAMFVVDNSANRSVPLNGTLEPTNA